MQLPEFIYHRDPIATGSIELSDGRCACCKKVRGALYVGPVYAEDDLDEQICPWCIADGSAAKKFAASFVDSEAIAGEVPAHVLDALTQLTPGYAAWQSEHWPVCCNDAATFLGPMGLVEIRTINRDWEGLLMGHIVHAMQISGGAATRLLDSLNRDRGPTAYIFECLHCGRSHFHIDQP